MQTLAAGGKRLRSKRRRCLDTEVYEDREVHPSVGRRSDQYDDAVRGGQFCKSQDGREY